jgi:hypothetical protein
LYAERNAYEFFANNLAHIIKTNHERLEPFPQRRYSTIQWLFCEPPLPGRPQATAWKDILAQCEGAEPSI